MLRCLRRRMRLIPCLVLCGVLVSTILLIFDPSLEQQEQLHPRMWAMRHFGQHDELGSGRSARGGEAGSEVGMKNSVPGPSGSREVAGPCGAAEGAPDCSSTRARPHPVDLVLGNPPLPTEPGMADSLPQKAMAAGREDQAADRAAQRENEVGIDAGSFKDVELGILPRPDLPLEGAAVQLGQSEPEMLPKSKIAHVAPVENPVIVNAVAVPDDLANVDVNPPDAAVELHPADEPNVQVRLNAQENPVVTVVPDISRKDAENTFKKNPEVVNMHADNPNAAVDAHGPEQNNAAIMFQVQPAQIGWVPPPDAGEGGKGLVVEESKLSEAQLEEMKRGKAVHHFNEFVSSRISLRRSLKDVREPECQQQQYDLSSLPDTSVVIIYHNEAWSTLLRTVHSVLDRSPPHLLKQIILVDDASDLDHLQKPLDDYVAQLDKVTVLRMPTRQGLIQARLEGFYRVTAATVVFLDSHCECTTGWLEPLLDRIGRDPTTVVVPVIENVDMNTWEYNHYSVKYAHVGTFRWTMLFNWMPMQPQEATRRKSFVEPVRTPTMAGGLFAINKEFFYKLGTYDQGMKIWGGENLELSFKIWMCGGTLETIPCSFVGHVFRSVSPHSPGTFGNYLGTNVARLTAVWLDEYSYYVAKATRVREEDLHPGDISDRLQLRRRLQCHSFGWFLMTVMPERFLPADRVAHGPIKNSYTGLCVASSEKNNITLEVCRSKRSSMASVKWYMNPGQSTVFHSPREDDEEEVSCLDFDGTTLARLACHGKGGNQLWSYSKELKQLLHQISRLCLEVSRAGSSDPSAVPLDAKAHNNSSMSSNNNSNSNLTLPKLLMAPCDPGRPSQQWEWDTNPVPGPSWRRDLREGKPVL